MPKKLIESPIMKITRQQFSRLNRTIGTQQIQISELEDKTEKSGETDGFQIFLFDDLPVAITDINEVRFYFVSDALDVGETAGNGTGCLAVYKPNQNDYYRVADNSVLAK